MRRPLLVRSAAALCALTLAACSSSGGGGDSSGPVASSPVPVTSSGSTDPATSTSPPSSDGTDWPMYHGTADRAGVSTSMPRASDDPTVLAKLDLDGAVYASPIVAAGTTVVATEHDVVYGFDAQYRQAWKVDLGDPSPSQERECGNIDPLGITGTPIYSAVTSTVYLVAEFNGAVRHELIALDPSTGKVRWKKSIDLPGVDAKAMQQRGALAITGGKVWVPFGGQFGDCGDYRGRVVGVNLDGSGDPVKYDPSSKPQGGMWNPAGATVDSRGHLYLVSANGSSFPGDDYDHTNSVDELDETGTLADAFAPSDWAENNQGDVGLGSQGVALVGDQWAVLGGKSGPVYVLRQGELGGVGGQVSVQNICLSFGGSAVDGDVVYLPCTDGVRAVRVTEDGKLAVLWHVDAGTVSGSPVIGGGRVWALDQSAGVLHALDPATGKTAAQVDVGETSRFATPALSGRNVLIGTLDGLTVVRTS